MKINNKIAIVYGCGGHREQADRLVTLLKAYEPDMKFLSITDQGSIPEWSSSHLEVGHVRHKNTGKYITPIAAINNLLKIYKFVSYHRISSLVSLGPGISILVSIIVKLFGARVVHIESWSRFYSISNTTKVMRFLADSILIQNIELQQIIKNSKYVGRL